MLRRDGRVCSSAEERNDKRAQNELNSTRGVAGKSTKLVSPPRRIREHFYAYAHAIRIPASGKSACWQPQIRSAAAAVMPTHHRAVEDCPLLRRQRGVERHQRWLHRLQGLKPRLHPFFALIEAI